jgi:hypothetical protein
MAGGTEPEVLTRTLIYIPIIHTQADMGALSESILQATMQKVGKKGLARKMDVIERIWTEIERAIDRLTLSYEKVRLYQDSLPVCGREAEIVKELAQTGSRNHQLLLRLTNKGATIMGTESLELLLEEYNLVKQILASRDMQEAAEIKARRKGLSDSLLRRRDQYIADRIDATLNREETGILFLGMLHSLEGRLAKDIRVTYPVYRPIDRVRGDNEKEQAPDSDRR